MIWQIVKLNKQLIKEFTKKVFRLYPVYKTNSSLVRILQESC